MKHLQSVEPFEFTFRVLDRATLAWDGPFDSIYDVFKKYGRYFADYADGKLSRITIDEDPAIPAYRRARTTERYAILRIEDGHVLTKDETEKAWNDRPAKEPYISWEEKRRYNHSDTGRAVDLIRKKGDGKKIKKDWASSFRPGYFSYNGDWNEGYYCLGGNMGYYHRCNTYKEMRDIEGIITEYRDEYPDLVRGHRRGLPGGWAGERKACFYDVAPSWKHHSKRRKQWIPKP